MSINGWIPKGYYLDESETYGERITNCLGCGEELHNKRLTLA